MSKMIDEYVKMAEKLGMITKDDYVSADFDIVNEKIARDKAMEEKTLLLYGLKPEGTEKPLMDLAHPGVAVVAPAEDRMNGIVENDQQRQDIMTFIANRPSNGKYQQKLFVTAHGELLNTLLKAGNSLDLNGNTELSSFADNCAERLTKTALPVIAWAGIAAAAAALGGIAAINYSSNSAQNVATNAQQVLDELEDVKDSLQTRDLDRMSKDLRALRDFSSRFSSLRKIENLTKEDVLEAKEKYAKELKIAQAYKEILALIPGKIADYKITLKSLRTDKGESDWYEKLKLFARIFSPDDVSQIVLALDGLLEACKEAEDIVSHYLNSANKYEKPIEKIFEEHYGDKLEDPLQDAGKFEPSRRPDETSL